MRARRLSILALLLLPTPAFAHLHKAGFFAGYSIVKGSRLSGMELSTEFVLSSPLRSTAHWGKPSFSLFADLGTAWGDHDGGERTQAALMSGLRTTFLRHRLQPFAHVALAGVRTQDSDPAAADTSWGLDGGIGASVRIGDGGWRLRAQADYTVLWGSDRLAHHYFRVSAGFEVRFGNLSH